MRFAVIALLAAFVVSGATADARPTAGHMRFVLRPDYHVGDTALIRIRNVGRVAYVYNPYYQACFMTFRTASGRRFRIPPGTHCDLMGRARIGPGQVRELFRWRLDECIKDQWGCVKSRRLPPGKHDQRVLRARRRRPSRRGARDRRHQQPLAVAEVVRGRQ
jgi:hypothetical protein